MSEADEWYDRKVSEIFKNLVTKAFCIKFNNNFNRMYKLDKMYKTETKLTYNNKYFFLEGTSEWIEALKFTCKKF